VGSSPMLPPQQLRHRPRPYANVGLPPHLGLLPPLLRLRLLPPLPQ